MDKKENLLKDSKIIDSSGQPMILYHGSKNKFDEFDIRCCSDDVYFGKGIYFTADRAMAATYAGNEFGNDTNGYIYDAFLDIRNPFKTMCPLIYKNEFKDMTPSEIQETLIRQGYDGVVEIYWTGELYEKSNVVAFYPEQIKICNIKYPSNSLDDKIFFASKDVLKSHGKADFVDRGI